MAPWNAMIYTFDRWLVQEAVVLLGEELGWPSTLWI
jgi:hypothetical protein